MGVIDKIKSVFRTLKENVRYECEACDYETERKFFDTDEDELMCPECGSKRVTFGD